MTTRPQPPPSADRLPLGQRLFDNVFLLLGAGILIMLLFYTGWGSLGKSPLFPAARCPEVSDDC